ncbi:MAG: NapC/NirT family cytochrome c [Desulfobacterales bacterium]|nr:MAG: NapC/NirT family cytochrome c [Desulfobacterales bacterium]
MAQKGQDSKKRFIAKTLSRTKKGVFLVSLPLVVGVLFSSHEFAVRYYQDKTCVVRHEMKAPIEKWQASGTAVNHNNCAGCHYDAGFEGWLAMNQSAFKQLVEHFRRDADEPIKRRTEPLFLEEDQEPGYWSHVSNHRCYQCKDAKNHKQIEQQMVHRKLIKDISQQPCKDCHNHEMRNSQKFYEKILPGKEKSA